MGHKGRPRKLPELEQECSLTSINQAIAPAFHKVTRSQPRWTGLSSPPAHPQPCLLFSGPEANQRPLQVPSLP